MAKLTRQQLSLHQEAVSLLGVSRDLTNDERQFVLANWRPSAQDVTQRDAFFTPPEIAEAASFDMPDEGIVWDLCAGIGILSFYTYQRSLWGGGVQIIAIEQNPAFVEVGRKVLPMVEWVEGDAFDAETYVGLPRPDAVISNPPYGRGKAPGWLRYRGLPRSWQVAEIAMRACGSGIFILPAAILPYKFDRAGRYQEVEPPTDTQKWIKALPGVEIYPSNFRIDAKFLDTGISTEIVDLTWLQALETGSVLSMRHKQEVNA